MTVSACTFGCRFWNINISLYIYIYIWCGEVHAHVMSPSLLLVLDGLHQWDPAGHAARAGFGTLQGGPHAAPDIGRAVRLVGLRGDLHLLHDELQEVVLLLQQAGHLLHP